MNLSEYLKSWNAALSSQNDSVPESLANVLQMPLERLDLYRGFVRNHYNHSVRKMFPQLMKLTPRLFTDEFIQSYFAAYPPTAWELNAMAKDFPEFLATHPQVEPAFAECARYESARFQVFMHTADETEVAGHLEPNHLTLSPALFLLQRHFDDQAAELETPKLVALSRQRDPFDTVVSELSILAVAILQTVSDNPIERSLCVQTVSERMANAPSEVEEEVSILLDANVLLLGKARSSGH